MSENLFCRVGYCPKCAEKKQPKKGQYYLAIGSNGSHVNISLKDSKHKGFSPHIFRKRYESNTVVYCDMICCMLDCGVYRERNEKEQVFEYLIDHSQWRSCVMNLSDWYSLFKYKRDIDYTI